MPYPFFVRVVNLAAQFRAGDPAAVGASNPPQESSQGKTNRFCATIAFSVSLFANFMHLTQEALMIKSFQVVVIE